VLLDLHPASPHRWSTWLLAPRPGRRRRCPLQGEAKDLAVVDYADSARLCDLMGRTEGRAAATGALTIAQHGGRGLDLA
jgi:hypothetical protein